MQLFEKEPIKIDLEAGNLVFATNFLKLEEADQIFETLKNDIAWAQGEIKMFGKIIAEPRLTAWYGDEGKTYRYSGKTNTPLAWSPTLLALKNRIEAYPPVSTQFSSGFNSVLLNFYRNGQDSMGWHADDEPELGKNPFIVSLNLGATRRFLFRQKKDKTQKLEIELTHGSLLVMGGAIQHHWQHAIPKSNRVAEPRINLTFRHIF